MEDLITIFKADALSIETRIRIIKQLGGVINHKYGSNVTEPLVVELVLALDPDNQIIDDKHYKQFL